MQMAEIIQDELFHSQSVLIPEGTMKSFLGFSGAKLNTAATRIADENGWTVKRTPDLFWLFERKAI